MDRDWYDFKRLYGGYEGARKHFEDACETLFRKLHPQKNVKGVNSSSGDGGIDIFTGDYGKTPLTVVQCKFFLEEFGESQKNQVRRSFQRAIENKDYEMKEWILAIPREFESKNHEWWSTWIGNLQKSTILFPRLV